MSRVINDPIQVRFLEFHQENPEVYKRLVALAHKAKARGKSRISIKMVYEVVRWFHFLDTEDETSDFKLSNDYHSRYARLIMDQEPELAGLFQTKRLASETQTVEIQVVPTVETVEIEDDVEAEIIEESLGSYVSDYWSFQAAS